MAPKKAKPFKSILDAIDRTGADWKYVQTCEPKDMPDEESEALATEAKRLSLSSNPADKFLAPQALAAFTSYLSRKTSEEV